MKGIFRRINIQNMAVLAVLFLSACGGGGGSSDSGGGAGSPGSGTPLAPNNVAPVVSAGSDFIVNLPSDHSLSGSASDDGLPEGSTLTYSWSKISGAGNVVFSDSASLVSEVSFSQAGVYGLRLSVSDGDETSTDDVSVTVNAAISVGGYVLKASHSLSVDRILPSDPETQLTYSVPDASSGLTTLSAVAGTFENNGTLYVINLSTQRKYQFSVGADGALSNAEIFAPYGSELLIRVKHAMSGSHFSELSSEESSYLVNSFNIRDNPQLSDDESLRSVSGFRVRVMPASLAAGEFYSVGLTGLDDGSVLPHALQGTLAATTALTSSSTPNLNMTFRLFSQGSLVSPRAEIYLKPTHNLAGKPLGATNRFVATVSDDNGNPLSSRVETRTSLVDSLALSAVSSDTNGMSLSLNTAINFSEYQNSHNAHALQNGHYMLAFNLAHGPSSSLSAGASLSGDNTLVQEASNNTLLLPVEIGTGLTQAEEPLLFFMDTTNDGYTALFDQIRFPDFGVNVISHMVNQGKPVLQRYHEDGRLREYNFSPFLPRFSVADRNSPSVDLMNIDPKTSSIQITLTLPSATPIVLPSVFGQYLSHKHNKSLNLRSRSSGGVHMTDIMQLVLNDASEDYLRTFSESGEYTMAVTGSLKTIEGKVLNVNQSVSFVVADKLVTALYSTLPMMPLQAGESIVPTVTLMPAIPANVTVDIAYAPQSGASTTTSFTGLANDSGVYVADSAMLFSLPGTYKVNIEVNYQDSNGTYFSGSRSFASVVADSNPEVVVHGQRGIDNFAEQSVPANRWFSRDALGVSHSYQTQSGHVLAPYEQGDIEWVEDDVAGVVRASLAYNAELAAIQAVTNECDDSAGFTTWLSTGELKMTECVPRSFARPLSDTMPTTGFTSYSYNGVERFSVRVRESVGDDNAHGYWRFDDMYGNQRGIGSAGDMNAEIKFQFIGSVVKDFTNSKNHYSSHATLFVLTDSGGGSENDTRVFPPFNGHGIQPGGGAIVKIANRDVNSFVWPTTLLPGATIAKDDSIAFYGQIAPTLPLAIELSITPPDGVVFTVSATANKDGFVRTNSILFDQAGLYLIKPKLTYASGDLTSAGALSSDIVNTEALLGLSDSYHVYVENSGKRIQMNITLTGGKNTPETLDLAGDPVFRVLDSADTETLSDFVLHTTVFMDGWILDQQTQSNQNLASLAYTLDLSTLAQNFQTLDINGLFGRENQYADLIRISFLLEAKDGADTLKTFTKTYTLDGENISGN